MITTVKPPIVDPPRKGHNIKDLFTRDTAQGPKKLPSLQPLRRGQPLYKGQS